MFAGKMTSGWPADVRGVGWKAFYKTNPVVKNLALGTAKYEPTLLLWMPVELRQEVADGAAVGRARPGKVGKWRCQR